MTNLPKGDYVNAFKPDRPPGRHVTPGVHDPETKYTPSNPLAWGPKGAWGPSKTWEQQNYEHQSRETMSYALQDGTISDQYTWEARGKQSESTFRPNPGNIAPRPKTWKPKEPLAY